MTTETRTTHTPGPWTNKDPYSRDTFIAAGEDDIAVALFDDVGEAAAQANARLIAAAPTMAEELRDAYVDLNIQANVTGNEQRKERVKRIKALLDSLGLDPFA